MGQGSRPPTPHRASGGDGWSVAGNRGVQGCASPAGHGGWHSWSGVDQELVFHPLSMSKCGVKGS